MREHRHSPRVYKILGDTFPIQVVSDGEIRSPEERRKRILAQIERELKEMEDVLQDPRMQRSIYYGSLDSFATDARKAHEQLLRDTDPHVSNSLLNTFEVAYRNFKHKQAEAQK